MINNNFNDNSHHGNSHDSSTSYGRNSDMGSFEGSAGGSGEYTASNRTATPFFADITLDISVAHDIAETPEAVNRRTVDVTSNRLSSDLQDFPKIPEFQQCTDVYHNDSSYQQRKQDHQNPSSSSFRGVDNDTTTTNNIKEYNENIESKALSLNDNIDYGVENNTAGGNYDFDRENHIMASVTSNDIPGDRFNWRSRLRRRQWPQDSKWTVGFWIIVPVGLLLPLVRYGSNPAEDGSNASFFSNASWLATSAPRSSTLHTLIWGLFFAAVILPRLLYRTSGGVGVGDDARHFASQLLLASAPISACVYLALLGGTYFLLPSATWPYGLIPLWYLGRDLYLFRRWKMTSTTPGGRQAFFQAITCAALDILSRSLRRKALHRTIIMIIFGQFLVIIVWRLSILAALRSGSFIFTIMAFVGGKWATGTVARLLTLMACGGVSSWFAEQSALMEEMQQMEGTEEQIYGDDHQRQNFGQALVGINNDDNNEEEMVEFSVLPSNNRRGAESQQENNTSNRNIRGSFLGGNNNHSIHVEDTMSEAYRIADASQYKPAAPSMEGDYESDDDESFHDEDSDNEENNAIVSNNDRRLNHLSSQGMNWQRRQRYREKMKRERKGRRDKSTSTVRQLLMEGLTVSFGSVAKCGLLGGLAQFVWSQIRKIDHAQATFKGMRGMEIGESSTNRIGMSSENDGFFRRQMHRFNALARYFVRTHSDMAMSYVADYQMSYARAAQEVAMLVDEAGVEPIIHDDISTHMSACVGGSISGVIILFTGAILIHQRNHYESNVPDTSVALDMLLAFFLCYTLIFTVMEPLRASIKAVYVCFAQHPEALSQAFPLIFHRLSRMSKSNLQ